MIAAVNNKLRKESTDAGAGAGAGAGVGAGEAIGLVGPVAYCSKRTAWPVAGAGAGPVAFCLIAETGTAVAAVEFWALVEVAAARRVWQSRLV